MNALARSYSMMLPTFQNISLKLPLKEKYLRRNIENLSLCKDQHLLKTLDVIKVFDHEMRKVVATYFSIIFALFSQTTLQSISKLVKDKSSY